VRPGTARGRPAWRAGELQPVLGWQVLAALKTARQQALVAPTAAAAAAAETAECASSCKTRCLRYR